MNNPQQKHFETTVDEKEIFTGRVFRVGVRNVILEDGEKSVREVVYHNGGVSASHVALGAFPAGVTDQDALCVGAPFEVVSDTRSVAYLTHVGAVSVHYKQSVVTKICKRNLFAVGREPRVLEFCSGVVCETRNIAQLTRFWTEGIALHG